MVLKIRITKEEMERHPAASKFGYEVFEM